MIKGINKGTPETRLDHGKRIFSRSIIPKNKESRITNSIFLAILDIKGFPFFLEDLWESWGASGTTWGLRRDHAKRSSSLALALASSDLGEI